MNSSVTFHYPPSEIQTLHCGLDRWCGITLRSVASGARQPGFMLHVLVLGFVVHFLTLCLQFSSVAQPCPTLSDPMNRSMPGLPVHHHLPEFTQTHVHRVCDAIQPSHPLSSPSSPAPNPSSIKVFSNESTLHIRWPKYWSYSFNTSPTNEHPALISLRMDWLDLLAVQGTLRSLLQHHSSKASLS